jgi:hypothetical protein
MPADEKYTGSVVSSGSVKSKSSVRSRADTYGPVAVEKTSSKEINGETITGVLHSFSLGHAFDYFRQSRCKPWDNRELDVLDGFKTISFILCTISQTAYSLLYTQTVDLF